MITVCPLHWYFDAVRLEHVMREMESRGAPTLRGHIVDDALVLLAEGTHRIRAAHALGLAPVIVCVPWWRSSDALERARHCARRHGLTFDAVAFAP